MYDYDGTCKTFMWNTFFVAVSLMRQIILTVASSRIASLMLPGDVTTNSKFQILVPNTKISICNINKKSELAELLKLTNIIIWSETLMTYKSCFEAFDKSLKDIMSDNKHASKKIFGEKIVVFGG